MFMQTLKVGQRIWIGEAQLEVIAVEGASCRLGVVAPEEVEVWRGEVDYDEADDGPHFGDFEGGSPCRD